MSFTLRQLKYRPWPVTVKLLEADETGEVSEHEFTFVLHFKPFSEAEFKAAFEASDAEKAPAADAEAVPVADSEKPAGQPVALLLEKNSKLFARLVDGWGKVLTEDGPPAPYSPEALQALVIGPDGLAVSAGIHRALNELRFGVAPAKNLPTSAAPGPSPAAAETVTNLPAISAPSV
jgi:hypothetical protein